MKEDLSQLVREIEQTILDKEHERCKLLYTSSIISIPYLLKVFGDTVRDPSLITNYPEFTSKRILHQLVLAISQSIKWVIRINDKVGVDNIVLSPSEISDQTADMIKWAFEYTALAQQFTAWSQGYVDVDIDLELKTIRFKAIDQTVSHFYYAQQEVSDDYIKDVFFDILSVESMYETYDQWAKDYNITEPPIAAHMDWSRGIGSQVHRELYSKVEKYVLPELPAKTELGGYTIGDFRNFFSSLLLNFHFICSFEDTLDAKDPERALAFGSNPLMMPKEKMIKFLNTATGLPSDVISNILVDLTLDTTSFHSNLLTQPVVLSSDGDYAILPNLFGYIEPNRMICGALNKSIDKKKIYDKLIDTIERKNIEAIGELLRENWECVVLNQSFKAAGKVISPDFILIDKVHNSLLILDYKHFLNPVNASETSFRLTEMRKGLGQIFLYENFFTQHPEVLTEHGIKSGFIIYKMLLTRFPTPVPIERSEILITDLATLKKKLISIRQFSDIESLLISDNRIEASKESFKPIDLTTIVGEWKFVRTIHAGKK